MSAAECIAMMLVFLLMCALSLTFVFERTDEKRKWVRRVDMAIGLFLAVLFFSLAFIMFIGAYSK